MLQGIASNQKYQQRRVVSSPQQPMGQIANNNISKPAVSANKTTLESPIQGISMNQMSSPQKRQQQAMGAASMNNLNSLKAISPTTYSTQGLAKVASINPTMKPANIIPAIITKKSNMAKRMPL